MKKKVEAVVQSYRIIIDAKLTKMSDDEKFALIYAMKHLRKISDDFNDFLEDARKKLIIDGIDGILMKIQSEEKLSLAERTIFNRYNQAINKCADVELNKEVELDFDPLSDDALKRLFASNDFRVRETLILTDVLGRSNGE